jgi:hypothetical protein
MAVERETIIAHPVEREMVVTDARAGGGIGSE